MFLGTYNCQNSRKEDGVVCPEVVVKAMLVEDITNVEYADVKRKNIKLLYFLLPAVKRCSQKRIEEGNILLTKAARVVDHRCQHLLLEGNI